MISRLGDDIEKGLHGERLPLNTLCLLFYSYFYVSLLQRNTKLSPLFEVCFSLQANTY
jgi:hypothetical protein